MLRKCYQRKKYQTVGTMDYYSSINQGKAEETPATPPGFPMLSRSTGNNDIDVEVIPVAKIPEMINKLTNKLTQECFDSKKKLKSIEDALKVETEERKKWENLQKKTKIELEKKLDEKQKYIGVFEERLNTVENRKNKVYSTYKKIMELNEQIQIQSREKHSDCKKRNMELIDQVLALQSLNTKLIVNERESFDMLQKARDALLKEMCDLKNQVNVDIGIKMMGELGDIGIKMMGELDANIFDKEQLATRQDEVEAVEWCTLWQKRLNSRRWYPFTVIVDEAGNSTVSLDNDDSTLQNFKEIWGEKAYDRFTSTLKELNEYNPNGRSPVPEFWNFKEDRKAPMEEVIHYIFTQMKSPPRKRMRSLK